MDIIDEAIELLRSLIGTPSFSKDEANTAQILTTWFEMRGVAVERIGNNIVAWHHSKSSQAPYILLNSHHDTVRPGQGWTMDPFTAIEVDGRLYGLGSNDAGAALVTMMATFMRLRQRDDLPCSIMFAATAEEEISGANGMALLTREYFTREDVGLPDLAIIGEPTQMNVAVAEKGLIVLDCVAHGRTGHAARGEGVNAIYAALSDINWFRSYEFERHSDTLGSVHMEVTQIEAGTQHNVIPDRCAFVVDVRVTDAYANEEVLDIIRQHVSCDAIPRSLRLQPSAMPKDHPFLDTCRGLGLRTYGSPTMSDQSLLPDNVPSCKIGPGDSARSHTPDEFIHIEEVRSGIDLMAALLEGYLQ